MSRIGKDFSIYIISTCSKNWESSIREIFAALKVLNSEKKSIKFCLKKIHKTKHSKIKVQKVGNNSQKNQNR